MSSQIANQDWVLARFREEASKNDPKPYAAEIRHDAPHVYTSVNGNTDWYRVELSPAGALLSVESEGCLEVTKFVSPKQRTKLLRAIESQIGLTVRKGAHLPL